MSTYLDTALNGELNELQIAATGRNNTLFKVAARLYQFVEAGAWTEDHITDLLTDRARAIGLDRNEVKNTLKSARKAAEGNPAQLPSGEQAAPVAAVQPMPPEVVDLPVELWREKAGAFADWSQRRLWRTADMQALAQLDYLYGRGLSNETIIRAGLGYNPADLVRSREAWGLWPDAEYGDRLWLPAGIVIPWHFEDELWRISIRRPIQGAKKYYNVPGGANALYNADSLQPGRAAALVEGVFDALAIQQAAGDLCGAVASGTTGARRMRWIARLMLCKPVLIAYDQDTAGQAAASWWLSTLGQVGKLWRPLVDDPAAMLAAGADVRGWIEAAL